MINSMTAFGRGRAVSDTLSVTVEVKSVNSRFFDCTVKVPRMYGELEERIKGILQDEYISRGKLDVFITVEELRDTGSEVYVDLPLAEKYISALRTLRDSLDIRDDISVMSVVRNPDIIKTRRAECDVEADFATIREALCQAAQGHLEMRRAEGRRIRADIMAKLDFLKKMSLEIEEISKRDTVGYRDKLYARIKKLLSENEVTVDENRLLTECAIFQDKIAIDEELVRLRAHFDAFVEIAELDEPSGRKLDFIVQEMNRETNTIGSKCNNSAIARIVVDMKGEIEKIREQIQNVE
ncbi:MAG: YicC family protein [Clostridia bacterium]|nr:YicC family protein [Clostridia bacterium]